MRTLLILVIPRGVEMESGKDESSRAPSSTKLYDEGWDRIFGKKGDGGEAKAIHGSKLN
jgi:hypothetical protein